MTAVLTIRAGGSVAGSCGKSCYDAEHPKCRCICIRLNHGVGLEQAIANTRAHHADWLARPERMARSSTPSKCWVPPRPSTPCSEENKMRKKKDRRRWEWLSDLAELAVDLLVGWWR